MSDATLLIKKIPSDLKDWLAAEAQRNHRSMNKETIRLLEEARSLRDKAGKHIGSFEFGRPLPYARLQAFQCRFQFLLRLPKALEETR